MADPVTEAFFDASLRTQVFTAPPRSGDLEASERTSTFLAQPPQMTQEAQ